MELQILSVYVKGVKAVRMHLLHISFRLMAIRSSHFVEERVVDAI